MAQLKLNSRSAWPISRLRFCVSVSLCLVLVSLLFSRQQTFKFACRLANSKDWQSATGLARAFSIGQKESSAVFALLNHVSPAVCARLQEAVTTRGMAKFLSHDTIGKGTFNNGWSSASGPTEAWSEELMNTKARTDLVSCLKGGLGRSFAWLFNF